MADKLASPEWLPVGWASTVKTSRNGNKYKCYIDPSHNFKFHSKPEVLRYLNSIESNLPRKSEDDNDDSGHPKSLEKSKETIKHSEKNVAVAEAVAEGLPLVVEEAVAEGLPPGWIKEVRVAQRGKSIRRDSYYTDPISGYVFLSLKDCKRYIKTGILGKYSYKPKDKEHVNVELKYDNISSPSIDQEHELQDEGTNGPVTKDNKEILSATITKDHLHPLRQNSDQCRSVVTRSGLNSQSTKSLEQREGKGDSELHTPLSSPVVGDYPKKLLENGEEIHEADRIQRRINKSNVKRSSEFPRRASKRLAGVELDLVPELKTNNRTRRLASRESGEASTSSSGKTSDLLTPEELPGKLGLETMASEQQRLSKALPLANLANSEEPVGQEKVLQISYEQTVETEPSPISKEQAAEVKPLPASSEQAGEEESMTVSDEEQGGKEELQLVYEDQTTEEECANKNDATIESPTNLSLADLWQDPCIEFAIKTLTGVIPIGEENKADENSGSSAEMSYMDIWMDPCIEFAVKTLTGAIPLDEDLSVQNLFQQQVSSSDTQGVGGIMLPNRESFCQNDYMSQHFNAVKKPQNNKQQVPAASELPQASSRSFQNSGGSGLH